MMVPIGEEKLGVVMRPAIERGREAQMRSLLKRALQRTTKSRPQIADELARAAGFRVTEAMLNDWLSPAKHLRFPASLVAPFCEIVGDENPAAFLLPYRLVFLLALADWVQKSSTMLERLQEDFSELMCDKKRKQSKRTRKTEFYEQRGIHPGAGRSAA